MATREERTRRRREVARGRQAPQKRPFPLLRALIIGGVVLVVLIVALVYSGVFGSSSGLSDQVAAQAPGGPVPTMPTRDHVQGKVQYNTNPPTSGNHDPVPATQGVYNSTPPPDEKLVHNLEHGNVVMYYNPAKLDEASVEKLRTLTRDFNQQRRCAVLVQRTNMPDDKAIALTSWGFLATLDSFDEGAIRAFWRDHVAQGPEFGPGQCG